MRWPASPSAARASASASLLRWRGIHIKVAWSNELSSARASSNKEARRGIGLAVLLAAWLLLTRRGHQALSVANVGFEMKYTYDVLRYIQ